MIVYGGFLETYYKIGGAIKHRHIESRRFKELEHSMVLCLSHLKRVCIEQSITEKRPDIALLPRPRVNSIQQRS